MSYVPCVIFSGKSVVPILELVPGLWPSRLSVQTLWEIDAQFWSPLPEILKKISPYIFSDYCCKCFFLLGPPSDLPPRRYPFRPNSGEGIWTTWVIKNFTSYLATKRKTSIESLGDAPLFSAYVPSSHICVIVTTKAPLVSSIGMSYPRASSHLHG